VIDSTRYRAIEIKKHTMGARMTRIERIYTDFPPAAEWDRPQIAQIFTKNAQTSFKRIEENVTNFVCDSICENLCHLWLKKAAPRAHEIRVNPLNPRHPRSH